MATLALGTKLRDAVAEGIGRLPDFDLDLDADGVLGERLNVALPVHLSSPDYGSSDLRFDGALLAQGRRAALVRSLAQGRARRNERHRPPARVRRAETDSGWDAASDAELAEARAAFGARRSPRSRSCGRCATLPAWAGLGGKATVALGKVQFASFSVDGSGQARRDSGTCRPERRACVAARGGLDRRRDGRFRCGQGEAVYARVEHRRQESRARPPVRCSLARRAADGRGPLRLRDDARGRGAEPARPLAVVARRVPPFGPRRRVSRSRGRRRYRQQGFAGNRNSDVLARAQSRRPPARRAR